MFSETVIHAFQEKILSWYAQHQRDLPWRRDREPYHILLSEIMLQQTQVSRVIPKYEAWLRALPTLQALATAKTGEVLRLWSGLGYNRRALYLQKTAQAIVREHNGVWPRTVRELKKLPGIGEYTARAIVCFAFDEQIAVVDTNIRRVILTQFQISNGKSQMPNDKQIQEIAEALLPVGKAYEWNQALMDYASVMLKQEKIPIPKQSTFVGSNRYYRGRILKLLLEKHELTLAEASGLLQKSPEETEKIVAALTKDGFVVRAGKRLSLREE